MADGPIPAIPGDEDHPPGCGSQSEQWEAPAAIADDSTDGPVQVPPHLPVAADVDASDPDTPFSSESKSPADALGDGLEGALAKKNADAFEMPTEDIDVPTRVTELTQMVEQTLVGIAHLTTSVSQLEQRLAEMGASLSVATDSVVVEQALEAAIPAAIAPFTASVAERLSSLEDAVRLNAATGRALPAATNFPEALRDGLAPNMSMTEPVPTELQSRESFWQEVRLPLTAGLAAALVAAVICAFAFGFIG